MIIDDFFYVSIGSTAPVPSLGMPFLMQKKVAVKPIDAKYLPMDAEEGRGTKARIISLKHNTHFIVLQNVIK